MVRHQRELVLRMELNQCAHAAGLGQGAQRGVGKEPREEMMADPEVGEPPLILDRGTGEALDHRPAEHAGAPLGGLCAAVAAVDLGILDAAGGRSALEEKPVHFLESAEKPVAELLHVCRNVTLSGGLHQPLHTLDRNKPDRIAGHAEPDLHLGAGGEQLDERHKAHH